MKKTPCCILLVMLGFVVGVAALFMVFRLSDAHTVDRMLGNTAPKTEVLENEVSTSQLTQLALEAAGYIKSGDYRALSRMIHPEYGVVISPYATVSLSSNKCFTREDVSKFGDDGVSYIWGITDDVGDPIEMTPCDYFTEYVYNFDYVNSSIIGINRIVKSGNSLENLSDMFPGCQFVDLHNPGTEETEYANWSTLRLVFEEYDGIMMLTAIIHSESTL